jgi:hypothetical protein
LEFTLQNAKVTFELPYQDRLHTILLRYRDVNNKDIGFDISTVIRLQGPRDENNGFRHAKQTTIIRYIGLQGNNNNIIETKFRTIYSRSDSDRIYNMSKGPEYSQVHKSLKYIVNVVHSREPTNLLNFGTIIHIEKNDLKIETSNQQQQKEQPPSAEEILGNFVIRKLLNGAKLQDAVEDDDTRRH